MSIRKHIPNSITSMNLLCGVMGVISALEGRLDIAFPLMILGAAFDFCDGFAARLLKAYSNIGKELDSLADMVSFGVLPSVMLYQSMVMNSETKAFWCYIPLSIAVFSALRLAKFNLDERQHSSFIGLPTPACAMICGSLSYYIFVTGNMVSVAQSRFIIPIIAVALSLLLVSEIPMFAMKFATGEKSAKATNASRIIFFSVTAIIALAVLVYPANWSLIPLGMFSSYILINIILCLLTNGKGITEN